uniref:Uncharacterized protein TCIL3000_11_380 n=1 Tax=Trypanosoma congolense (strain IL3000) TaxID=1068625 RepID=G0UZ39_TRYCI|nr:unnamed protein product [Trypanosoma congolense IL3000]
MGRNKKGKNVPRESTVEEECEEQQSVRNESEHSCEEAESAPEEESAATKKKVYHGSKLNKNQGKRKAKGSEAPAHVIEKDSAACVKGAEPGECEPCVGGDEDNSEHHDEDIAVELMKPVDVLYCPNCTFPAEMCEFSGMYEQCRPWLLEHAKELADAEERGRKRRVLTEAERIKRLLKGTNGKKGLERIVLIDVARRTGSRMTTTVKGLDLFGLNLKDLAREWKKMFSCGVGIKTDEKTEQSIVDIQGSVVTQLVDILPDKYGIPKGSIYRMENKERIKCYEDE